MQQVTHTDFQADIAPRRAGDPATLISDNRKVLASMNWKPKYDNLELICQSAFKWENKEYDKH